MASSSKCIA